MDVELYKRELAILLGGPVSILRNPDGTYQELYRDPFGSTISLPSADKMSAEQRREQIDSLRIFLGLPRRAGTPDGPLGN